MKLNTRFNIECALAFCIMAAVLLLSILCCTNEITDGGGESRVRSSAVAEITGDDTSTCASGIVTPLGQNDRPAVRVYWIKQDAAYYVWDISSGTDVWVDCPNSSVREIIKARRVTRADAYYEALYGLESYTATDTLEIVGGPKIIVNPPCCDHPGTRKVAPKKAK